MKYTNQIRAFSIDRILEMHKITGTKDLTVEKLIADAEKLSAFAYTPRDDVEDISHRIAEVKEDLQWLEAHMAPPASNVPDSAEGNA